MAIEYKQDNVELEELTLVNFKGIERDITGIFRTISFEEDLFLQTMVGKLTIVEMHDFQQNFPLVGEEKVRIKYRSAVDMPMIELEFMSYLMTDKIEVGNGMFGYTLHLCSEEFLRSRTGRSTNAIYKQDPVAAIRAILSIILGSKKTLTADNVKNSVSYISNRLNPLELISSIVPRCASAEGGVFSYVFFESTNGFNFRSLDVLKKQKSQKYTFIQKASIPIGKDMLRNVEKMTLQEQNNVIDRFEVGAYGSNVTLFDPIMRNVKRGKVSYFDKDQYDKLEKSSGVSARNSFQTSQFEFTEPSKEMLLPLSDRSIGKAQRLMAINMIEYGIKANVETPGNSSLKVGDMVDFDLLSSTGQDIIDNENDRYLSGLWMVVAIRHEISNTLKYRTAMQWAKDSYSDDHERNEKLIKRIIT